MKKLAFLILAYPSLAFAHKITFDSDNPAFQILIDDNRIDLIEPVANYCGHTGQPLEQCIRDLRSQNALDYAAKCQKGFDALPFDATLAHMAGGGGGCNGYWHNEYVYTRDLGNHKHTWSQAARDEAGREIGTRYVEQLKSRWEQISSSTGSGSTTGGHTTISAETKGIADMIVKGGGEFGVEHKKDSTESTTVTGPSQSQLTAAFKQGYEKGYNNPQLSSFQPDVFCKHGDKLCGSPQGPVADPDTSPAKPADSSKDCPTTEPPQSKAPDPYPDFSLPVSAPEPAKVSDAGPLKSGETYTDDIAVAKIHEGSIGDSNPLAECVAELRQEELQQGYEYSEPKETKSLKQLAEEELAAGHCITEWFGEEFCRQFYAQSYSDVEPAKEDPAPVVDQDIGWMNFAPPEPVSEDDPN